jgi:hypothetical protein
MMEEKQSNPCIVCGQMNEHGIVILSEFLCDQCEAEIVETDVQDLKYPYFVRRLEQLVQKRHA